MDSSLLYQLQESSQRVVRSTNNNAREIWRSLAEGFVYGKIEGLIGTQADQSLLESVDGVEEEEEKMRAYDNIDGLVEIDNDAFLVDDGNGRNCALREHVHNVKYGSIEGGGGDGMVRIVAFFRKRLCNVGTNL